MTRLVQTTLVAAFLFASSATLSLAQQAHNEHHPEGAPKTTAPSASSTPGMTGGAMAPGGMMGAGGMPMMKMMRDMMGHMGGSSMAMPGMDMADHVEGRIAFLRAELNISDTQSAGWNHFAQALRTNAKTLGDLRAAMAPPAAAPQPPLAKQLEQQERWYAARLDGIRALKSAFEHLYGALSPDQQKSADKLMGPHLGLMPMAAMSMAGMSSGQMQMPMMPMEGRKP